LRYFGARLHGDESGSLDQHHNLVGSIEERGEPMAPFAVEEL
jgi:hypothetical protein